MNELKNTNAIKILKNLNLYSFLDFSELLFKNTYDIDNLPQFSQPPLLPLKYYITNIEANTFNRFENIHLFNYFHRDLIQNWDGKFLDDKFKVCLDVLKDRYPYPYEPSKYLGDIYLNSIFFVSNLFGIDSSSHDNIHFPQILNYIEKINLFYNGNIGIGTLDTFLTQNGNETINILYEFINKNIDGISLEITKDLIKVVPFQNQSIICGGIENFQTPIETVVTTKFINNYSIFKEFENIINEGSENQLEEFISTHYQLFLGNHYDRVETQIWLKFPNIDVSNKERRLDIFARNTLSQDWDLFELKKNMPITKMYRDVPTFTSELSGAISQLRNYQRILQQDKVKKYFAEKGINYYEPSLNLVVGRTPQISTEQWRRICSEPSNINVLTYDNLLSQAKNQIKSQIDFLNPSHNA